MTLHHTVRRLDRLETMTRPRCPQCGDHPTRILFIDGATDTVVSDNFPDDECPGCGRVPYRELRIVGDEPWQEPVVSAAWGAA